MDRKQAETRVQMWLVVSDIMMEKPNYEMARRLANLIYNLSDKTEVYTSGFIYDCWCMYKNEH